MAHQANARILTALAQRLDMPREKFPSNIAEVGHARRRLRPLLLAHTAERRRFQAGDRLILTSLRSRPHLGVHHIFTLARTLRRPDT
ncbi:3-oxoacyl-[acyl-carrier-protein] synthase III C-terminal domain-containing protein [Streptomyces sp. KL116D]|uniref:3-oxoacyl-[acyl-carrier-protein] synthase III C-terminal domain-containing protein n=1 Tax=Streptomyces sp. KL116D TaxID=3045152 RepID=UPI0035565E90